MSPKEAKVFIAEDDPDWMKCDKEAVTRAKHQVIIAVNDVKKGLKAVPKAKELGVNVALIDGKIPFDSSDGPRLAAALREAIPEVKVVDVSAFGDAIKDADAKMPKVEFSINKLGKLITKL